MNSPILILLIFQIVTCALQVKIWDERKVFGTKAQNLMDIMLGDEALPPLEFNKKRSRTVKIMRRDSRSIRTVRSFFILVLVINYFYFFPVFVMCFLMLLGTLMIMCRYL